MLAYSWPAVLVCALPRFRPDYRLDLRFASDEGPAGGEAELRAEAPKRIRLPAVLIRGSVALRTADGRALDFSADPERPAAARARIPGRGAYASPIDELTVRDAFGFFVARRLFEADRNPRLYALPEAKAPAFACRARSGGDAFREEPSFRRTDELTESRKYVSGDDPRRINWKVYGHSGELFVREGDPEPPPRARYAVLVDSSVDGFLYPGPSGAAAVDALASYALGAVLDLLSEGLELSFGGVGLRPASGDSRAAARFYARVFAVPLETELDLEAVEDPGVRTLVFALPRRTDRPGPLDRFLSSRPVVGAPAELLFCGALPSGAGEPRRAGIGRFLFSETAADRMPDARRVESAVDECVRAFGSRGAVHARRLEV